MALLYEQHYDHHVLRMPVENWPDPVQRRFAHMNPAIYASMQGPSELGMSATAKLATWDRTTELASVEVPLGLGQLCHHQVVGMIDELRHFLVWH